MTQLQRIYMKVDAEKVKMIGSIFPEELDLGEFARELHFVHIDIKKRRDIWSKTNTFQH